MSPVRLASALPSAALRPLLALAFAGAGALALGGCGMGDGDEQAAASTSPKGDTLSREAKMPESARGTQGAVQAGLPSVVALSVNSGGATRTGTGTLLARELVVTDAKLVSTASGAPAAGVTVREGNGDEHAGVVDGIDELSGLAAVRVRTLTAVPVAKASTEAPELGQAVMALGYLSARRAAIRPGTVVTTDRAARGEDNAEVGLFEASSALGAQGTGGPIVDSRGGVIGITTKRLTSMVPGTVVAMPIGSAQRITKALGADGSMRRAYLGLETVGLSPSRAQELRLATSSGVLLRSVAPGSPASFVQLRKPTGSTNIGGREIPTGGDVIVQLDGQPLSEPEDLDAVLATLKPGQRVALKIIRGQRSLERQVTLSER